MYLNAYTSLALCIQPNQNTSMLAKDNKKEEYSYDNKKQGIKKDQRNLVDKNLDNENVKDRLARHIP